MKGTAGGESEDESKFGAPGAPRPLLRVPDSWLLTPEF